MSLWQQGSSQGPMRKGKWLAEEEDYAKAIIASFNKRLLRLEEGTTLRAHLAMKLQCDPMRVTKKFKGSECLGKRVYQGLKLSDSTEAEAAEAHGELATLKQAYLMAVEKSEEQPVFGARSGSQSSGGQQSAAMMVMPYRMAGYPYPVVQQQYFPMPHQQTVPMQCGQVYRPPMRQHPRPREQQPQPQSQQPQGQPQGEWQQAWRSMPMMMPAYQQPPYPWGSQSARQDSGNTPRRAVPLAPGVGGSSWAMSKEEEQSKERSSDGSNGGTSPIEEYPAMPTGKDKATTSGGNGSASSVVSCASTKGESVGSEGTSLESVSGGGSHDDGSNGGGSHGSNTESNADSSGSEGGDPYTRKRQHGVVDAGHRADHRTDESRKRRRQHYSPPSTSSESAAKYEGSGSESGDEASSNSGSTPSLCEDSKLEGSDNEAEAAATEEAEAGGLFMGFINTISKEHLEQKAGGAEPVPAGRSSAVKQGQ
ncbi:unnamed protein product [Chrysoparadoxa australica]